MKNLWKMMKLSRRKKK